MKKQKLVSGAKFAASLLGIAACGYAQAAPKQPNIILIMADDLGWGDTGFNGNKIIQTPNLDQMASEGVTFERFYSASAVSSPTRASVLTGRNPFRTGVFTANNGILRPEEVTIPELLKEEGYATGHFGKWHLGTLTHTEKDANRGREGNLKTFNPPKEHGYDAAMVSESKVPTWDPMKKPKSGAARQGWDYIKEGEDYNDFGTHYWDINGTKITENLDGCDSRAIMDRVLPFIAKSKKENKPFLSVVWFHAPHMPCVAGPKYAQMYSKYDKTFKNYAGCVTAMDEQVGRLRAFLKANNLDENTMIWFCSDNGPENGSTGVTGGFRDRKRSLHEGGVRVPGCMVWPAKVKKPIKTAIPAVTSDYLPTIVSAVGIDKAKCTNKLDGIDLIPIITGKQKKRNSPIVFSFSGQTAFSADRFKAYTSYPKAKKAPKGSKATTEPFDKSKLKVEYYDIVADPYEKSPLPETPELKKMLGQTDKVVNSYRNSFEGGEYGTKSYDKLGDKWQPKSLMPQYR